MRAQLIALLGSVSLFFVSTSVSKAQKPGKWYVAKVITVADQSKKGTFSSVDEKGVYLASGRRRVGDTLLFVPVAQIREIKLRRKGKVGTGSTIGFTTGLAAAVAANIAFHSSEADEKRNNALLLVGGTIFTFATTAIGGALSDGYDEKFQIFGQKDEFLKQLPRLKKFSPAAEPLH